MQQNEHHRQTVELQGFPVLLPSGFDFQPRFACVRYALGVLLCRSVARTKKKKVERGKILAGRIKELGNAGDFEGMLEALEEGPKNAIVCT